MLEKSGTIVLTVDDLNQFNTGKVSDRVTSNWGLTFSQLKEIVDTKCYVLQSAT